MKDMICWTESTKMHKDVKGGKSGQEEQQTSGCYLFVLDCNVNQDCDVKIVHVQAKAKSMQEI